MWIVDSHAREPLHRADAESPLGNAGTVLEAVDVSDDAAAFDELHRATVTSTVYRSVVRAALPGLPEWLVPFSVIDGALLERFARYLDLAEGATMLDLACGTGGPGLWIAERCGAKVFGVDFAESAIDAARALAKHRSLETRACYSVRSAIATALPDASVDAVMSVDALMFVDSTLAVREIVRVLKPGGRVVFTAAESLVEPFVPTLVRDYRPLFESAGFTTIAHETDPLHDVLQRRLYAAIVERAQALRDEVGGPAETLIDEARSGLARSVSGTPPRVRNVFFAATLTAAIDRGRSASTAV